MECVSPFADLIAVEQTELPHIASAIDFDFFICEALDDLSKLYRRVESFVSVRPVTTVETLLAEVTKRNPRR